MKFTATHTKKSSEYRWDDPPYVLLHSDFRDALTKVWLSNHGGRVVKVVVTYDDGQKIRYEKVPD